MKSKELKCPECSNPIRLFEILLNINSISSSEEESKWKCDKCKTKLNISKDSKKNLVIASLIVLGFFIFYDNIAVLLSKLFSLGDESLISFILLISFVIIIIILLKKSYLNNYIVIIKSVESSSDNNISSENNRKLSHKINLKKILRLIPELIIIIIIFVIVIHVMKNSNSFCIRNHISEDWWNYKFSPDKKWNVEVMHGYSGTYKMDYISINIWSTEKYPEIIDDPSSTSSFNPLKIKKPYAQFVLPQNFSKNGKFNIEWSENSEIFTIKFKQIENGNLLKDRTFRYSLINNKIDMIE